MTSHDYRQSGPGNPEKQESYQGVGSFILEIVKIFFMALVIITPIRMFLFQPFFVQGASMEPNFKDGEYLIINELGYKTTRLKIGDLKIFSLEAFKELERGDTIVFHYPKNPSDFYIKRVIGLPGEKVKIKNGRVIVSDKNNPEGEVLNESSYLPSDFKTEDETEMQLEDDQYFVMGDNRSFSYDSRKWGPLNKDEIIGRVVIRAWPFNKVKLF